MKKCVICGVDTDSNANRRKYCIDCLIKIKREWGRKYRLTEKSKKWLEQYKQSSKFKISRKIAQKKYRENNLEKVKALSKQYEQSPRGKLLKAEKARRYHQSANGKKVVRKWHSKYLKTPKGKAHDARHYAKRRIRSTNPELFALRVKQLHELREPCAVCGMSYKKYHSIDHILALCNGGIDEWGNYQPICIECYTEKTKEDFRIFKQLKEIAL